MQNQAHLPQISARYRSLWSSRTSPHTTSHPAMAPPRGLCTWSTMTTQEQLSVMSYRLYEHEMLLVNTPAKDIRRPLPTPTHTTTPSARALHRLPFEIMVFVAGHLDLATLHALRLVNRATHSLIDSLTDLNNLYAYAPSVLKALTKTGAHAVHTLNTLYGAFLTPDCHFCATYGPYLYLLCCKRICFNCLEHRFSPASVASLQALPTARDRADANSLATILAPLPRIKILPGLYGDCDSKTRRWPQDTDVTLVDLDELGSRCSALGNQGAHTLRGLLVESGRLRAEASSYRYAAVTAFPYMHTRTHQLEFGLWCRGCEDAYLGRHGEEDGKLADDLNRAYSIAGFREHAAFCLGVQRLVDEVFPKFALESIHDVQGIRYGHAIRS